MLHTKFQGHWPFSSWDEEFQILFTTNGHDSHLGHVTLIPKTNFDFSTQLMLFYMQFGFNQLNSFR